MRRALYHASRSIRLLRRILPFSRRYAHYLWIGSIGLIVSSVLGLAPPLIAGKIIDALPRHNFGLLAALVGLQMALAIVQLALSYLNSRSILHFSQSLGIDIRLALGSALQHARYHSFVSLQIGEISNRLDYDVQAVISAVSSFVPTIVSILSLAWLLVLMPILNWRLSVVGYVAVPLWFVLTIATGPSFAKLSKETGAVKDRMDTVVTERLSLSGILRAKVLNGYATDSAALKYWLETLRKYQLTSNLLSSAVGAGQNLISTAGPAFVLLFGGYLVARGQASVGTLVAFFGLLSRAYSPITALAGLQTQVISLSGTLERVFELFDLPKEAVGGLATAPVSSVALDDVTFVYAKDKVLDRVSVTFERGEKVVLIGPSGCGKTTLARLLLRLYEPTSGRIYLGGTRLDEIDVNVLRSLIGYIPQEPSVFTGSIRENLLYAKPTASENEIWRVLRLACIDEFVSNLPEGLDATIGSQGAALSGGQRQRLTIARALLADPAILILDEATSAVDPAVETAIYENILQSMEHLTVIVIAHKMPVMRYPMRTIDISRISRDVQPPLLGDGCNAISERAAS